MYWYIFYVVLFAMLWLIVYCGKERETPMSTIWYYPQQVIVARFTSTQQQFDLRQLDLIKVCYGVTLWSHSTVIYGVMHYFAIHHQN